MLLIFGSYCSHCFFGGLAIRGGQSFHANIVASASQTRGADYKIICTIEQLQTMSETVQSKFEIVKNPGDQMEGVYFLARESYKGGCERDGRSSVFFLLNLWPITDPLDPERAIAMQVQQVEGDTMINLRIWHEIHYYGIVGRVAVWRVRGDVIKYVK